MINRRQMLRGSTIGAAGLAVGCDCGDYSKLNKASVAENCSNVTTRNLKMVTTWPKDFPGLGTMAERVAEFVTTMSGGAMTVTVYAAGELVPALESFDAVSNGSADIYHGAEYYWVGKSQAYPFFTAVPMGMTANEISAWTEFGGGQELWDELAARHNIKPFAAGNTGHQMGGWYKNEINNLGDIRGLKVRMPGLGGEVLRRLGGSAVTLSGGEIYQALQSGAIDGTEWVGPWNDLAFGFYREAKYYYWPGFHEPGAQLGVGLNLELWNGMSPQEQAIIRAACHQANHLSVAEYGHFNSIALQELTEKHGVELRQFPEDVMEAVAETTKTVLEEVANEDELSQRIFESYKASLTRSQNWSGISDEPYMAARRRVFSF